MIDTELTITDRPVPFIVSRHLTITRDASGHFGLCGQVISGFAVSSFSTVECVLATLQWRWWQSVNMTARKFSVQVTEYLRLAF